MEKDIVIGDLKLHYEETGPDSAPPVVLMHGWGCDHTTVRSMAAVLEKRMHVYNLDLPGHGQSDEPPADWGVYEYADTVGEFITRLGLKAPSLVGHSYGGRIQLVLGARGIAGNMVVVDGAGIKPRRPISYYLKVYSFKTVKKFLPVMLGKKVSGRIIDRWRGATGSADYRAASPVMRAVMSKSVNQDLKHLMPEIKVPVLLVWGEDDTATPLADARYMETHIPDAGLVSFPGCGHYSFLDNPGGTAAVLKSFFHI